MSATPEDAVRAMQELAAALEKNSRIAAAVGQQLYVLNQILTRTNQVQGGAAILGALMKSAAKIFSRTG